jgi:hypothetical protein
MSPQSGDAAVQARLALLRAQAIDSPLLAAAAADIKAACAGDTCRALPVKIVGGDARRVRPCSGARDWPTRTDVWCWYCCHPFDTPPLPMPVRHDARRDVFHVTGTFCSWACIKAFNSESSSYLKNVNAMNIALFHKRCTGSRAHVRPAPPRIMLRAFGGAMGIDEFRAASGEPREFRVLPPKMIVHHAAIEETSTRPRAKPCNLSDTVSFKDVSAKNETLRLKRPKPLQHNRNTLARTMGINALMQPPPVGSADA